MTIAELGFEFISTCARHNVYSLKIRRYYLKPEDVADASNLVGKKYFLNDVVTHDAYVFDLTGAKVEENVLVFPKGKTNFYRV